MMAIIALKAASGFLLALVIAKVSAYIGRSGVALPGRHYGDVPVLDLRGRGVGGDRRDARRPARRSSRPPRRTATLPCPSRSLASSRPFGMKGLLPQMPA